MKKSDDAGRRNKGEEKKISLKWRILIYLVALLAIVFAILALVFVSGKIVPHDKHFDNFYEMVGYKPEGDKKGAEYQYHYVGHTFHGMCYVDSNDDLSDKIVDGECDLMVRNLEIREYKTDNSGIFTSYPIVAYEYVKIEDEEN